jgi:hypothetical protein
MTPEERWEFHLEDPEVIMCQILEDAIRSIEYMGGTVWAEGNQLRVRAPKSWRSGGRVVKLES